MVAKLVGKEVAVAKLVAVKISTVQVATKIFYKKSTEITHLADTFLIEGFLKNWRVIIYVGDCN